MLQWQHNLLKALLGELIRAFNHKAKRSRAEKTRPIEKMFAMES